MSVLTPDLQRSEREQYPATAICERLYSEYHRDVLRFLRQRWVNRVADDLAQEVWIKVYRWLVKYHERFDPTQEKTWLLTIANHVFLDSCRELKRQPDPVSLEARQFTADRLDHHHIRNHPRGLSLDISVEAVFDAERLREIIAERLTMREQFIVERKLQGTTAAQIAEALGTTENTVKITYNRARKKLAACIQREEFTCFEVT